MTEKKPNSVDEVITIPVEGITEEAIQDAVMEIFSRADDLAGRHEMLPPIDLKLLDGHGVQLMCMGVDWDSEGNSKRTKIESAKIESLEHPAAGLFLTMQDSRGKTATLKLRFSNEEPN